MSSSSKLSRIHVLGVGNIGRLFAHALATSPNPPPITLLLHRPNLLQEWEQAGRTISITTHGKTNSEGSYDAELISPHGDIIKNLIVATKTLHTTKALEAVKHRLNSESTLLFTQNGMGTTEEVTKQIFPDEDTRPNYLTAITSHGIFSQGPFNSVFAGQAHVSIGHASSASPQSEYLLNQISDASILNATKYDSRELKMLQLEKLVINAMINPLTVIFDCQNGQLFNRAAITRVMRLLLLEASHVIASLPELRPKEENGWGDEEAEGENIQDRFSKERLEVIVLDVADKTAANTSSMLQDFRAGRETEADYINGYIVKRGRELGVDVRTHEKVVEMIKKQEIIGDKLERAEKEFPMYDEMGSSVAGEALWIMSGLLE